MTSNAVFSSAAGAAAAATAGAGGGHGDRSGGADAPLLFELLHEVSDFQDGESAELFHECVVYLPYVVFCRYRRRPKLRAI